MIDGRMQGLIDRADQANRDGDLQTIAEGWGDVVHRRYRTDFHTDRTPQSIIETIGQSPNDFAPRWLANFQKVRGQPGELQIGDRFDIHITGPWDGPVEVIDRTETSFALATRDGHMEAGVIEFHVRRIDADSVVFDIESVATSAGPVVWFAYAGVRVAKAMQTRMWYSFSRNVGRHFANRPAGVVTVNTRTYPRNPVVDQRLRSLRDATFNYEIDGDPADDPTWYHDAYENIVGTEPPGPPVPGGVFETAKQILIDYKFPDPRRLVGHYNPAAPLAERTMVLEAKLLGQRRYFGTRVSKVVDDQPTIDGKKFTRFGWAYRTLAEHYEVGEMFFAVTKDQTSGEVRFAIKAYSRPGRIPGLLDRWVFWAVGRRLQRQFGRRCVARMRELVEQKMAGRGTADAT